MRAFAIAAAVPAAVALCGCGSAGVSLPAGGPGGSSSGSQGYGMSQSSGALQGSPMAGSGSAPGGGTLTIDDASTVVSMPWSADASPDALMGCATETQQAKELPLDLYFLLDASNSMADLVTQTVSKWQAVSQAIESFVTDPGSAGIGFGLQYFPLTAMGFPATCTSSAQCGTQGVCFLKICYDRSAGPCNTNRDCPGRLCGPVGTCQNDDNQLCIPGAGPCAPDANGFSLGACQTLMTSRCLGSDDCSSAGYASPAVGIGQLPGIAGAVAASLAANAPRGATPTQPALEGALAGAQAYAKAHPDHVIAVVLATDGFPDEIADSTGLCTGPSTQQAADAQVAQAAAFGLAATPSIKTFAIGVFAPSDVSSGTSALDAIATAGGTGQPFVIQTASAMNDTERQFLAALNSIRGASLPCAYSVPVPASGTPDFFKVNVVYTSSQGAATTEPYVTHAASCDPSRGGWYYDVDPATGATPTTITTCPATCSTLKADSGGRLDIVLGCQTQTIIH